VTFDLDANGILSVSAKDMASGKTQQIKITAQSGLTEEEIQKAVKEAELRADEDKNKAEAAMTRNNLDNLIYQTEKLVKDSGAQLGEADSKKATEAATEARKVFDDKSAGLTELKAAHDKLQTLVHQLTSELYKKQGAQGAPGANGSADGAASGEAAGGENKKDGDDVIDADYKDVN
jgi:molecular chaperone DnaK